MVCLRLDIFAKKQLWQINYDCVNVSTELPSMSMNGTTRMMDVASEEMSTARTDQTSRSSTTESVMETTSTETVQTSGMNSTLAVGMMEQATSTNETVID